MSCLAQTVLFYAFLVLWVWNSHVLLDPLAFPLGTPDPARVTEHVAWKSGVC